METDRSLAVQLAALATRAAALWPDARVGASVTATRTRRTCRLFVTLPWGETLEGVGARMEDAVAALDAALAAALARPADDVTASGVWSRVDARRAP